MYSQKKWGKPVLPNTRWHACACGANRGVSKSNNHDHHLFFHPESSSKTVLWTSLPTCSSSSSSILSQVRCMPNVCIYVYAHIKWRSMMFNVHTYGARAVENLAGWQPTILLYPSSLTILSLKCMQTFHFIVKHSSHSSLVDDRNPANITMVTYYISKCGQPSNMIAVIILCLPTWCM
jgi:hypothetical protein